MLLNKHNKLFLNYPGLKLPILALFCCLLAFPAYSMQPIPRQDKTPPTGSIAINGLFTNTRQPLALVLTAKDNSGGSGISKMQFSNDSTTWLRPVPFSTTKTWSISQSFGFAKVYARFADNAGNWSPVYSATTFISSPKMVAGVTNYDPDINDDGKLDAIDVQLVINKVLGFNIGNYNADVNHDGKYDALDVQLVINAVLGILPPQDTTPPTGSIVINNSNKYTNTASVTLNLSAQDNVGGSGISQMQFSNNNSAWSVPEAYAKVKPWTLVTGEGTKTVYVKFKDAAGNWSQSISASIILDTTPPVTRISSNMSSWSNKPISITLSATDNLSEIYKIYYWINNSAPAQYTAAFSLSDGTHIIKYYAVDKAGNTETVNTSVQFKIDTIQPTGSIQINNGDATTESANAVLSLSAVDSLSGMGQGAKMIFSNDGTNWTSEEDYANTKNWQLSEGFGIKTVYVKYKDFAGNWSAAYSDTINVAVIPKERIYIYLNGQRIAMEENGKKFFYHNDHLGGTNIITDENGQQVKHIEYAPFGDTELEEGSLNTSKKFTANELDDSTGLYNYQARIYDPKAGRFISADTAGIDLNDPQSLNRYSYCLNNPLKYTDLTGHSVLIAIADGAVLVAGYLISKLIIDHIKNHVHDAPLIKIDFKLPGFSHNTQPPSPVESPSIIQDKYIPEGMSYTDMSDINILNADDKTNTSITKDKTKKTNKGLTVYRQGRFADDNDNWEGNYVKGDQWSAKNPLTEPDFAKDYGLPKENSSDPDWIATGEITGGFTIRDAPPSYNNQANTGGGKEIVPNNPDEDVRLDSFTMP